MNTHTQLDSMLVLSPGCGPPTRISVCWGLLDAPGKIAREKLHSLQDAQQGAALGFRVCGLHQLLPPLSSYAAHSFLFNPSSHINSGYIIPAELHVVQ
jgi:hypothetical protein